MGYKKGFRKGTKKNSRRGRKNKMSFDKRVLSVVNKQRELKVSKPLSTSDIVDRDIGVADLIQLMPDIPCAGTGKEFERVGNEIILKKLVINAYYSMEFPIQSSLDTRGLIRHMVLKQRNCNSADQVLNTPGFFLSNTILENATTYNGTIQDFNTPINSNAFIVRKQMKKVVSAPITNSLSGGGAQMGGNISKSYWMVTYTLTFGKGKKLEYRNSGAVQPTNFPYFLAHSAAPMGQPQWFNDISPIEYFQTTTAYYYDD